MNYVTTNSSIPSLVNASHHFVVTTSATGLTVTMDGTQVLNYTTDAAAVRAASGSPRATGGGTDIHQVQNVAITARAAAAGARPSRAEPGVGAEHGRDHRHHHRDRSDERGGREVR